MPDDSPPAHPADASDDSFREGLALAVVGLALTMFSIVLSLTVLASYGLLLGMAGVGVTILGAVRLRG